MERLNARMGNVLPAILIWALLSLVWSRAAGAAQPMKPFGVGTHWNEYKSYALAKNAGVEWLRLDINWYHLQPDSATQWDWGKIDTAINEADRLGLKVLAVLSYSTPWARSGSDNNFAPKEQYDGQYQAQLSAIVNRYKDRVAAWEIMNEPDHNNFLKVGTGSWAANHFPNASSTEKRRRQYLHMMDLAKAALAPYRSQITLTTSGYANGGNHDTGFLDYLRQQPGFFAGHDVLNAHAYGYPSYTPLSDKITQYDTIRDQQMSGAPLWITEHGITGNSPESPPADSERYLVRSYATALADGAEKLFWFRLAPGGDHVTLLKSNGQPSALLPIYGVMTQHWNDPVSIADVTGITGVQGAIADRLDGQRVAILWSDQQQPISITALPYTITQAFDMRGNPLALTSHTKLSANPIYVYTAVPEPALGVAWMLGSAVLLRRSRRGN